MSDAKVAVITAGGGGMGAAVARELHQCGYEVAPSITLKKKRFVINAVRNFRGIHNRLKRNIGG